VRLLTFGNLDSSTSPRLPYAQHHRPSTSAQRATIRMCYKPIFSQVAAFAPQRHSNCEGQWGGGVVSPSAFAFGLFSNLTVCGTPAMTAGEC
jgi:hypothetical protein